MENKHQPQLFTSGCMAHLRVYIYVTHLTSLVFLVSAPYINIKDYVSKEICALPTPLIACLNKTYIHFIYNNVSFYMCSWRHVLSNKERSGHHVLFPMK